MQSKYVQNSVGGLVMREPVVKLKHHGLALTAGQVCSTGAATASSSWAKAGMATANASQRARTSLQGLMAGFMAHLRFRWRASYHDRRPCCDRDHAHSYRVGLGLWRPSLQLDVEMEG